MSASMDVQEEQSKKPVVFVTGFGPFRDYKINASWEAVKGLRVNNNHIELMIKEVPVVYEEVEKIVSQIWEQHEPLLVIHCGVSWKAVSLVIETRAFSSQYNAVDILGCIPCTSNGDSIQHSINQLSDSCKPINCEINLPNVCDKINQAFKSKLIAMPAFVSDEAGRYLCEYIYYKSLCYNPNKTVFIHVPEIDNPYSLEQITQSLQYAVDVIINQVMQCDDQCINDRIDQ